MTGSTDPVARIEVDQSRCVGHARCFALAPDIFLLDDDGYIDIERADVSADRLAAARDGEAACPERAITLVKLQQT